MRLTALAFALALSLCVSQPAVQAQQTGKMPRVAFLSTTAPGPSPTTDGFRQGLSDLGYIEGRNIAIEWRWGRGSIERFPEFAAEMVKLKVDVIVAANDAAGRAAQRATKTIPIVIAIIGDPVGGGFAASLARPGGNVTGLTASAPEVTAKRLQILKEAFPSLARVGLLVDVTDLSHGPALRAIQTAAETLGIRVGPRVDVSRPEAFAGAFATMTRERATVVFVVGGTMLYANRMRLGELALTNHLPMMCGPPQFVVAGCLMGYSADIADIFRRSAVYVDKILKGARPTDLPIEQPTKFQLAINLKSAKSLGATIAPSVLARADQVIE
jgi:putative ABC transport system substrate-binding protein